MKFGSPEWAERLVAALRTVPVRDADFTLQQVVTGSLDGEFRYWVSLGGADVRGGLGDAPSGADVTITQDYETAVALASGELIAQAAFMQGRLKITGNMGKLLKNQTALDALIEAMSKLDTQS